MSKIFGLISFANVLPLKFFIARAPWPSYAKAAVRAHVAVPSALNRSLARRQIGAAISSSIASARRCYRNENVGICAASAVLSVLADEGAADAADAQSATSNALAGVLGARGRVIIGDLALREFASRGGLAAVMAQRAEGWRPARPEALRAQRLAGAIYAAGASGEGASGEGARVAGAGAAGAVTGAAREKTYINRYARAREAVSASVKSATTATAMTATAAQNPPANQRANRTAALANPPSASTARKTPAASDLRDLCTLWAAQTGLPFAFARFSSFSRPPRWLADFARASQTPSQRGKIAHYRLRKEAAARGLKPAEIKEYLKFIYYKISCKEQLALNFYLRRVRAVRILRQISAAQTAPQIAPQIARAKKRAKNN